MRAGQVQVAEISPVIPPVFVSPTFDLNGTSYKRGDFKRNPQDATEVGARFHFLTESGIESTINYVYGRGKK